MSTSASQPLRQPCDAAAPALELSIVVINFRTPGLVIDCLESLLPELPAVDEHFSRARSTQVVVVENGSGDDSAAVLERHIDANGWGERVRLCVSAANTGFSGGNNIGIRAVCARRYLLLNSDTIVRPGALLALVRKLDAMPDIGLVGPKLEWPDGTVQTSTFRLHSPGSEVIRGARSGPVTRLLRRFDLPIEEPSRDDRPEWLSFACVMIRAEVFDRVGLLDEGFFLYYEDVEFCRRAIRAGFEISCCREARVVHLRGGSGEVKSDLAARRRPPAYYYKSRSRYFRLAYGPFGLLLANLGWMLGHCFARLHEWTGRKRPHVCEREATDIWMNFRTPLAPHGYGGAPADERDA